MGKRDWSSSVAMGAFLGLVLFCAPGADAKDKLKLTKVYEYRLTKDLEGPLDFTLDPTGKYLYLVDMGAGEIRISDWKSKKEIVRRRFNLKGCPPEQTLKLKVVEFITGTAWLALNVCDALLVVDAQTLDVAQQLTEPPEEVNDELLIDAAPNGEYLAAARLNDKTKAGADKWTLFLFGHDGSSWRKLAEWRAGRDVRAIRFSPDSATLAVTVGANDCGTLLYDVPEGTLRGEHITYLADGCGLETWFEFLPQDPTIIIAHGFSPQNNPSILFRRIATYELVRAIEIPLFAFLSDFPTVSPDGRLVAMGTCYYMPEDDIRPCSVLTIWETQTGQVVYQSPKWFTWPTRWATPRFAADGKRLLVLRPGRIEINEVVYQEQGAKQ